MKKFYFTFGNDENYPYPNGWVEVIASDIRAAAKRFQKTYPSVDEEVLNCSDYYNEGQFLQRVLPKIPAEQRRCHAVIIDVVTDNIMLNIEIPIEVRLE